jgi:hypothetical protein
MSITTVHKQDASSLLTPQLLVHVSNERKKKNVPTANPIHVCVPFRLGSQTSRQNSPARCNMLPGHTTEGSSRQSTVCFVDLWIPQQQPQSCVNRGLITVDLSHRTSSQRWYSLHTGVLSVTAHQTCVLLVYRYTAAASKVHKQAKSKKKKKCTQFWNTRYFNGNVSCVATNIRLDE